MSATRFEKSAQTLLRSAIVETGSQPFAKLDAFSQVSLDHSIDSEAVLMRYVLT